jgi:two-component system CheB/CheR fusion protein
VSRAAEVIRRNALAQSQLVSDLLDLSRLQTGKLAINHDPVSLLTIISDALETVKAEAEAKHISLKLNASRDPFMVDGDPVRLGQIAWNLLNNAVKFTGPGGEITITLEAQGTGVQLVIEDTGQGIAPEFLPYVFEIFRQGDASSSRRQGGLGIGLALVKQLVELHGGIVRAESEGVGHGAKFSVWLPLREIEDSSSVSTTKMATGALEGTCILVVDDSIETTDMLSKLLQMDGAEVHTARGGMEALALAGKSAFDLVISDISMPEMDGYQLLRELRQLPQMASVPALALTGFGRLSDVDRAHREGFTKHFTKPLDIDKLLNCVRELTRRNGTKIAPQTN